MVRHHVNMRILHIFIFPVQASESFFELLGNMCLKGVALNQSTDPLQVMHTPGLGSCPKCHREEKQLKINYRFRQSYSI